MEELSLRITIKSFLFISQDFTIAKNIYKVFDSRLALILSNEYCLRCFVGFCQNPAPFVSAPCGVIANEFRAATYNGALSLRPPPVGPAVTFYRAKERNSKHILRKGRV